MNKAEIVARIAEITGGTKKEAVKYLEAFKQVISESLKAGKPVKLYGFVNFKVKNVPERTARNPRTGETIQVPAHMKASASLSKSLRKF